MGTRIDIREITHSHCWGVRALKKKCKTCKVHKVQVQDCICVGCDKTRKVKVGCSCDG